jgi:hypothetical protein
LEDSPSGLWRTLGKRVGFTPSGVRIPHPPQVRPGAQHDRAPGFVVRSRRGPTGRPRAPDRTAHPLRHVAPDRPRDVLVARGHRGRRPAHQAHDRTLRDAEDQQRRRGRVAGVMEPTVPDQIDEFRRQTHRAPARPRLRAIGLRTCQHPLTAEAGLPTAGTTAAVRVRGTEPVRVGTHQGRRRGTGCGPRSRSARTGRCRRHRGAASRLLDPGPNRRG